MTLTDSALTKLLGSDGAAARWGAPLRVACERFGIVEPLELAHWLAQCGHESSGFTRLEEGLSYSAERLMAVWPRRFPTLAAAQPFARNPEKLANRVYSGRMGNGPPESGDGWRYRGRGLIMLTGGANYAVAGDALTLPLLEHPEMLATPGPAALTAAWFWRSRGCGAPAMRDDVVAVTTIVNGGTTGLDDRRAWLVRAKAALTA